MAYATVAEFRAYYTQVSLQLADETLIAAVLARATAIIDTIVGWSFTDDATEARTLYGNGTTYLPLRPYVLGSVTAVSYDGTALVATAWRETARSLLLRDGTVWADGEAYAVTATWGYAAVPDDIVEACLEIAGRLWQGRSSGFSDVIGVEGGGAVGYQKALPALVREILTRHQRAWSGWLGVT